MAKKIRGRPPKPMPPKIDATSEEIAKAMFQLPADHKWRYLEQDREESPGGRS